MKRSKRILSLLLSIVLILGMLPMFVLAADSTFSDVKTFDWFYNDVKYVCEKGLMKGTSSNTFSPKATTSRGMIVTILYRLLSLVRVRSRMFQRDRIMRSLSSGLWKTRSSVVTLPARLIRMVRSLVSSWRRSCTAMPNSAAMT